MLGPGVSCRMGAIVCRVLESCDLMDEDLGDLATCLDDVGRENVVQL